MYKLLAKANKLLLPSFTKQQLDLSKAKKLNNINKSSIIKSPSRIEEEKRKLVKEILNYF